MRVILLGFIKTYWFLVPPKKRNRCLFKKSCSNYVFNISKEQGMLKGVKALLFRWKHCRPGYYIINGEDGKLLISARNEVFDKNEIDKRIFNED